ncbi:MAG: hypothetical protein V3T17_07230 [Pseudomonadales bacterium]
MVNSTTLCWICSNPATTGEHRTKASDLKSEFGKISQKSPLYLNSKNKRNVKINSIKKSSELKYNSPLCPNCNNARTASHDNAWLAVSKNLRARKNLSKGSIIKLEKIFPGTVKDGMLKVHLFFVKQFGCAIQDLCIPIDIKEFSEAILNETAHPKVHISFGASNGQITGSSDVELMSIDGCCVFATWFYVIGEIAVNVMFAEPSENRQGLINSWHPSTVIKRMKLAEY